MHLGVHGAGEGRGHSVSPRAQLNYAALLPRRGPHIASHSVCPSVRPSRYRCHGWRLFGPLGSRMYFSARTEGRISYGHLGRTDSCLITGSRLWIAFSPAGIFYTHFIRYKHYLLLTCVKPETGHETNVSWPGCDQSVIISAEINLRATRPGFLQGKTTGTRNSFKAS